MAGPDEQLLLAAELFKPGKRDVARGFRRGGGPFRGSCGKRAGDGADRRERIGSSRGLHRAYGGFGIGAQGIGSLRRGYVEIRQPVLELEVHAVVVGGVRGHDPLRLKLLRVGLLRCYGVFDVFLGLKSTRCVRRGVLVDLTEGLLEFGDFGIGELGSGEFLPDI